MTLSSYRVITSSYCYLIILFHQHIISSCYIVLWYRHIIVLSYQHLIILSSYLSVISWYIHIASPLLRRCSTYMKKTFENKSCLKTCFKNMFLGQIIARSSFLNCFFAKKWFHCSFTVSGPTARSSSSREGTKTCLDTQWSRVASRARTHATQTQTRNTTSRLAVSQRTHPPNLRYIYIDLYMFPYTF